MNQNNDKKIQHKSLATGFLLAFVGTSLFSLKSIFIKFAYQEGLNADSVLMLRMMISLPFYLLIIFYLTRQNSYKNIKIKSQIINIVLLGFIGYFLASWLDLKGLELISAGLERMTLFTYPIFTAILGFFFFNLALNKKIIIVLIMTYLGLWIIFNEELKINGNDTINGILLVLLSALSYSIYILFGKKIIHQIGSLWFTALAMSVSSIFVLFYYGLIFHFHDLYISNIAWFWVFLIAIISTIIPSFMISEAIHIINPTKTSIVGTIGPIVTILLAVIFLNEPFGLYHMIGASLVITGVVILIR